jgi:hypothetical protein
VLAKHPDYIRIWINIDARPAPQMEEASIGESKRVMGTDVDIESPRLALKRRRKIISSPSWE